MAHRIPTADAQKVIGYLRVSTDEQTLGPEAQRAALERWCSAHYATLLAVYSDQGVSGGAALDKRPALLAALGALKEHNAGVLLVAKRDRLARDTMLAAMVERLAEREGATVRTADGAGDGDGPEAVLMRRIVDAFAEYERLLIKARTRAALAVKRARNERTGDIPYGWQLASERAIGQRLHAAGDLPRSGGRWHAQTVANVLRRRLAA